MNVNGTKMYASAGIGFAVGLILFVGARIMVVLGVAAGLAFLGGLFLPSLVNWNERTFQKTAIIMILAEIAGIAFPLANGPWSWRFFTIIMGAMVWFILKNSIGEPLLTNNSISMPARAFGILGAIAMIPCSIAFVMVIGLNLTDPGNAAISGGFLAVMCVRTLITLFIVVYAIAIFIKKRGAADAVDDAGNGD